MTKRIKVNNHIRQSNHNITRKPKLSINEHRLYYAALATVTEDDTVETAIRISVQDFIALFKLDKDGVYTELKKTANALRHKQFEKIEFNSRGKEIGFESENLFYKAKYRKGDAEVTVWLGPTSLDYAKKGFGGGEFNFFAIKNIADLSSGNSIRFYELMNTWKGMPRRFLPLAQFKDLMGLKSKYIGNNPGFIRKVISQCVEEVSSKTDLKVYYHLTDEGADQNISFTIKPQIKKTVSQSLDSTAKFSDVDNSDIKSKSWDGLRIKRKDRTYLMFLNLVKEDSPAAFYGEKSGSFKKKEAYLIQYLDAVDQMVKDGTFIGENRRERALETLEILLKYDRLDITPYSMLKLNGFDEDLKLQARARAIRQHNAIFEAIKNSNAKKSTLKRVE